MKYSTVLASRILLFLMTALAILFSASLSFGQVAMKSRLWSVKEYAIQQARRTSGSYRYPGDWCPNSPGDQLRQTAFSDSFKAAPFTGGYTIQHERQDLSIGYPAGKTPGYDPGYPLYQLIQAEASAKRYWLTGDVSYGMPVLNLLLMQRAQTGRYCNVGTWGDSLATDVHGNLTWKVPFEAGTFEAFHLSRYCLCLDYIWALATPTQRTQLLAYISAAADYYLARFNAGAFGQNFPNHYASDYTVTGRDANARYCLAYGRMSPVQNAYYAPQNNACQAWSGDGTIRTHRNADGSLGFAISRLAQVYNNRSSAKMEFLLLAGALTGNEAYITAAKTYAREWLRYSVYPGGVYGEYERNGNYGNPSEGASFYGPTNLEFYIMSADWLAKRGDRSLYQDSTQVGMYGSECSGTTYKSLKTVIYRYIDNMDGSNPIYWSYVSAANRITFRNPNSSRLQGCQTQYYESPFDYLFAVANRYYHDTRIKNAYLRYLGGVGSYSGNMASGGSVWVSWCGPTAVYTGVLQDNAQTEDDNIYGLTF